MKTTNLAYATLDDIVFEGRNHEYGAYLLRRNYHQNLWRGTLLSISVFMLLLCIPLVKNLLFPPVVQIPAPVKPATKITIIDVVLPEEKITPPVQPQQVEQQQVKTTQQTEYVIKEKLTKPSTILTQEEMGKTNIGTTTQEGLEGVKPPVDLPAGPATTGGTTLPEPPPVFVAAEVMPEFPGGYAALQKYLMKNLEYPALARRNNVEGTVILAFVVNTVGEISDIQVIKSLGAGTDEEAKRVIKAMPRWSPGKNNGVAVNVKFVVPVRFAIQ